MPVLPLPFTPVVKLLRERLAGNYFDKPGAGIDVTRENSKQDKSFSRTGMIDTFVKSIQTADVFQNTTPTELDIETENSAAEQLSGPDLPRIAELLVKYMNKTISPDIREITNDVRRHLLFIVYSGC